MLHHQPSSTEFAEGGRVFDTLTSQWTGALADLLGAVDALVDTPQPD